MAVASAAMSPSAGDLICVELAANCKSDLGTSDLTFVITDTIGDSGGTAWSRQDGGGHNMVCTRGAVAAGNYMEKTEIWWRVIGTGPGVAKVVTATGTAFGGTQTSSTDGWIWGQFLEVSGQASSNPIGFSTGATSRQATGPTTYTMTMNGSASSTSALVSVIHGDNTGVNATLPSGWSILNHNEPAWGAASKSADVNPLSGGAVNPQWTGLDTASNYLATCMEIKAAAGSSFIAGPPLVIRQAVPRASVR